MKSVDISGTHLTNPPISPLFINPKYITVLYINSLINSLKQKIEWTDRLKATVYYIMRIDNSNHFIEGNNRNKP